MQIGIGWHTASGTLISTSFSASKAVPANITAGTLITETAVAPATAAFAQIIIEMVGTPANTVEMLADFAQLNPGSAVGNGQGNGIASIGPQAAREHWQGVQVSVSAGVQGTVTNESQCAVYTGTQAGLASGAFVDQTSTGSSGGGSASISDDVRVGQFVIAQWLNGDCNAVAIMRVQGTRLIGYGS